jgi:hypothetical protein
MRATLVLSLIAAGSIAAAQGCSSSSAGNSSDAGHDSSLGEGGLTICQGDPPVLMWADPSGALQPPDWSCYQDGGVFAAPPSPPLPLIGGDSGDDGGSDAAPGDDGSTDATADAVVDAVADAPATETGTPEAGMPEAGPTQDLFQLTDFTTHAPTTGATVDIFFGNTVAGATGPDYTGMTSTTEAGAGGIASFAFPPPPGTVFGYRVRSQTTPPAEQEVVELDNLTPVPGTVFPGQSITTSEYQTLLAGVIGTSHTAAGTEVLVFGARDCASHELLGAIMSLVDDATGQPIPTGTGATDVHESYFGSDNFPHPECTHTVSTPIALWAAINVPTTTPLRLQILGRMTASDAAPVLIGERKVELIPDDIMIQRAYRLTPLQ